MSNPFQKMLDNTYKKLRLPFYSRPELCIDCNVAYPTFLLESHFAVCVPRRERMENPMLIDPEWRKE